MTESIEAKSARAIIIFNHLESLYPNVTTFLTHDSPFQLLIAVILSAQCTDARINTVTPKLFALFPDAKSLADAPLEAVVDAIKSVTFFNAKARHVIETAKCLMDRYSGAVPNELDALIQLPGVGRKTANVVLGQAFGIPGITVDTHVNRMARRLGFTQKTDAELIERDLMAIWPKRLWTDYSTKLIVHARSVCPARSPKCDLCVIRDWCPSRPV